MFKDPILLSEIQISLGLSFSERERERERESSVSNMPRVNLGYLTFESKHPT